MSTQGDLLGAADARELVPGDPERLNDVATLLQSYSSDLATTAQALTTLSTSTWTGVAADQFRATFAPQPGRWQTAADAFAQASRATSAYATSLLLAQDDAADALVRFRRGAEGLPVAMLVGPRSEAALAGITHDPGVHDRLLAVIALDEARERVRTAGVAAHNAIRSATADAPENAAWWQSAAAVLGAMAWTGAKATLNNVLVPAINGVASFGAAMTSNPVGSMYLGAGVLMVIGGAALDVGGAAVCVTGVGCAATPAAEAAGTGLIVSGVGVAAGGAASVAGTAAANPITVVNRVGGESKPRPTLGPATGQRPPGVGDDWLVGPARDGKGVVWQAPGQVGDANQLRIKSPDAQNPYGSVRFYNEQGQPIDLNGKPTGRDQTHIPIRQDGTYPLPKGWNP